MEQREIQQTFIRSAIRVIAQKGLVKATTKAIAADAGLNEAYIYKCFKGKDELLAEALHDRDEGLAVFLRREFPNVLAETSPWRDRCFHLWEKTWKFILDKRDDCIFYLRYYSSPDFYAYEHDRQQQYYHALIQRVAYLFRPETDLDMLMHQVLKPCSPLPRTSWRAIWKTTTLQRNGLSSRSTALSRPTSVPS